MHILVDTVFEDPNTHLASRSLACGGDNDMQTCGGRVVGINIDAPDTTTTRSVMNEVKSNVVVLDETFLNL